MPAFRWSLLKAGGRWNRVQAVEFSRLAGGSDILNYRIIRVVALEMSGIVPIFTETHRALMQTRVSIHIVAAGLISCLLPCISSSQEKRPKLLPGEEVRRPVIPEDLMGDEHVREEFGVNEFTTPSIRKLFEMLDAIGTLSYEKLHRKISDQPPTDRVLCSLGMGALIADGFLVVQCEKVEAMEDVGRALLKHAKSLGAGSRMNKHTQSLFEHSLKGDWKQLRTELALTQADVEGEMVQLRDVDIAHLVSLGGWLRALQISTRAVIDSYQPEKSRQLGRRDIVEYYLMSLETLHPDLQELPAVKKLRKGLEDLLPMVDVPEGKVLSMEEVKAIGVEADQLARIVTGQPER